MKILALCFFNNYWPEHEVTLIDSKLGGDVLTLPCNFGKKYDLVIASPPCTQFTKANSHRWLPIPQKEVNIARACYLICIKSGKPWLLENVPGRIEEFIPELKPFRVATWQSRISGKQHNIYSNILTFFPYQNNGGQTIENYGKRKREMWQPDLVADINNAIVKPLSMQY